MERVVTQPRLQNGGPGEETLDEAAILDTPKNPRVFCHVRFKISPFRLNTSFRSPENKHGCQSLKGTFENALLSWIT